MSKVTVVANASYAVCLDNGRHLHPGEVASVDDSERHQQYIADGALRLVSKHEPKSEPAKGTKPDRTQEV